MVKEVKVIAAKYDDLSLSPGSDMMKGELNQILKHTYRINKCFFLIKCVWGMLIFGGDHCIMSWPHSAVSAVATESCTQIIQIIADYRLLIGLMLWGLKYKCHHSWPPPSVLPLTYSHQSRQHLSIQYHRTSFYLLRKLLATIILNVWLNQQWGSEWSFSFPTLPREMSYPIPIHHQRKFWGRTFSSEFWTMDTGVYPQESIPETPHQQ